MITEMLYYNLGELIAILGDIGASVATLVLFGAGIYTVGKIANKCLRGKRR